MSSRPLHPRHGPHDPATATPPRRPGSIRRTTTHDSLRPDGLLGPLVVVARGRDLHTGVRGATRVLSTASVDARIDYVGGRSVTALSVAPTAQGLDTLIGVAASSGFRQALDEVLPGERGTGSLRYQLLDDLPTAALVSGFAVVAAGVRVPSKHLGAQNEDLCAGWATGGTIMLGIEQDGFVPVVTGPPAPTLLSPDDDLAWHDIAPLSPHGMRRWRRIDVWRELDVVQIECFFRDSHVNTDGLETVVHEYAVGAAVDPSTMRFTKCEAAVGVLPWMECPGAAASAGRLVGAPASGLRQWVRETFVGPPTCTHLNDTLRAMEDVPVLVAALAEGDRHENA